MPESPVVEFHFHRISYVFSSPFPFGKQGKVLCKELHQRSWVRERSYARFWRLRPFFQTQYYVGNGRQNLAYERSHRVLTFYIFFLPLPSPIRGVVAPLAGAWRPTSWPTSGHPAGADEYALAPVEERWKIHNR